MSSTTPTATSGTNNDGHVSVVQVMPLDVIELVASFLGIPHCGVCRETFDTDLSLQCNEPSEALHSVHRLPVRCKDCKDLVCYLCVVKIYKAELQFRQGGFPGRPFATCPHCRSNRSIRVASPKIDGTAIDSFLVQKATATCIRDIVNAIKNSQQQQKQQRTTTKKQQQSQETKKNKRDNHDNDNSDNDNKSNDENQQNVGATNQENSLQPDSKRHRSEGT